MTMKREDYTEREIQAYFAERYMKEHDLSKEDAELMNTIRKMPVEIVKFHLR